MFEKNVTKKDASGLPSEGLIAIHFGITADIRTLTDGNLHLNIYNACNQDDKTMYKLKQVKDMYELLKPGLIIVLKKGKSLYAWAEITSPYYHCITKEWPSCWNYKILRFANSDESEKHEGWMKTFHANTIEIPQDVIKIQAKNKLIEKILEHREKMTLLYAKMQEASDAFQEEEETLKSLERTLELSGVI